MTPKESDTRTAGLQIKKEGSALTEPKHADRSHASQAARETLEETRQAGADTLRRTAEQGEALLGQQKQHIADTIHDCGDALRSAADDLREKHDPNIASLADALADRLERSSTYLKNRQPGEIRQDIEKLARQQPHLFYGGLFVAGLALSRFFKSSQVQEARQQPEGGMEAATG
jgi:ABC-type transporter Mla subunit MlaD